MKKSVTVAVLVCGFFCAPLAAVADMPNYSQFGIAHSDMAAYKRLSIPSCESAREQNKDPMHPLANVNYMRHIAHLYGQCHNALQQQGAALGVIRANDYFFGMACMSLGAVDTGDDVDPVCNMKSSLPSPY